VAKKRETTSETLANMEQELKKLNEEIKQKRSGLKEGDEPLKGEAVSVLMIIFINQISFNCFNLFKA
jgi:peptidoglycan hydrolase CwlO-like protein